MIQLKPLTIDSTGWLEATWINVEQKPDKVIPATDDKPKRIEKGDVIETQVYCQSFHPTQIYMLRAKAAEYDTSLEEYEQILADWVNSYVPEPPVPVEPVPRSCTPAQGLVALYAVKGITEDDIRTVIDSIPDPVTRYTAKIGYERATVWEEGSSTMQMMQAAFNLSYSDMGELFDYAVQVKV